MEDLLTSAQHSDEGFTVPSSAANVDPDYRKLHQVPRRLPSVGTLSDCNTTQWVDKMFPNVIVMSVGPEHELDELFLTEQEARFLEWVRNDLDELTESVRSSRASALCRRFVEGVGMALASVPDARCAVFGDEEDGVELVAHSRSSMRQVSFEFGLHEDTIRIVQIDEHMRLSEHRCRIVHVQQLGSAIAWLNPR